VLLNAVTLGTVLVGAAASMGLTEDLYPTDKVLTGVVTLVAAQMLLDRLAILSRISEQIENRADDSYVRMLPRTDPEFQRFSDFAAGAQEVMVIGVDLGFMMGADAWFVKQALNDGVNFKLLMVDPATEGDLRLVLNRQDERNGLTGPPVHDHIAGARRTLETIRSFADGSTKGSLEIRGRVDIPSPGMTLLDPTTRHGKIRVEVKLYHRNHGQVPYFILDRTSAWYDMYHDHYYRMLWNDSPILYSSQPAGSSATASGSHR
jgi:hypothetical protein